MKPLVDHRSPLAFLRRHWIIFAVACIATLASVVYGTLAMTPQYEATAKVMIQLGREYSSQPTVGDRQAVLNRDPQAAINTELHILLSQDLIESVVSRVGAETLYPPQETDEVPEKVLSEEEKMLAASRKLSGAFTARLLPESSVIQLALRHPDPETAKSALTVLFDEFKSKHLVAFGNPQVPAFLEEKVSQYRNRLDEAEDRLKTFLTENEAAYVEAQAGDTLVSEHARLEAELKQQSSRVAGLRQQIQYVIEQREQGPTDSATSVRGQQNPMVENARLKLLDLQVEEERLLGTYSETSRPVMAIREQIKIVEDFLAKQEHAVGTGQLAQVLASEEARLNSELQFELARGQELSRQLARLDQERASLPERTRQYRDLVRERDLHERYLNAYQQELEEARLASDLDQAEIANIVLIQAVRVTPDPVSPNRRMNFAVGAVLALIVGAAAAFAAEMWSARRAGARSADDEDDVPGQVADGERREDVMTPFGGRVEGGPRPSGPRQL